MANKNHDSCMNTTQKIPPTGVNEQLIRELSSRKNEPEWMLALRLKGLQQFEKQPLPSWGPSLVELNPNDIHFYLKPLQKQTTNWQEIDPAIKKTFDDLGVPQAEQKYLAGLGAQYESEMIYHHLKKEWQAQGVVFLDTETGLKQYPELFKTYFGSIVPFDDNKFAALNTAVWSGGSFIYIPKNVTVTAPLQTYFRINSEQFGQFERTLIIADENSFVHYIEGCTAPTYSTSSLHSAVVEIIALKGARVRYTTIQNWAPNIYNLVTKRAHAYENSLIEWIDGNFGSKITMKYPAVILKKPGARAQILSLALANHAGQIQDSGGKVIHESSHTSSKIVSKSIAQKGGRTSYRGAVIIKPGAKQCKSFVQCDALLLDKDSRSDAYPYLSIAEKDSLVGHEASISNLNNEQTFYLLSRGFDQEQARSLIINGFIEEISKELPLEYAIELNRLINLQMDGSIG